MARVEFDEQPSAAYAHLEKSGASTLLDTINDAVDLLESNPGDAAARRRSYGTASGGGQVLARTRPTPAADTSAAGPAFESPRDPLVATIRMPRVLAAGRLWLSRSTGRGAERLHQSRHGDGEYVCPSSGSAIRVMPRPGSTGHQRSAHPRACHSARPGSLSPARGAQPGGHTDPAEAPVREEFRLLFVW
jgi:hypothetical protein